MSKGLVMNLNYSITNWLRAFSFLGLFLLTPGMALFADEQSDLFAKLDSNGDGLLESQELSSAQKSIFERLIREGDGNKDGKISLQEFKQATTSPPKQPFESVVGKDQKRRKGGGSFNIDRLFDNLDTNNDGKLTRGELPARAKERMGKLFDKLGKDQISKKEFLEVARKFKPQPGQFPGKPGKAGTPGLPGKPGAAQASEFFKRFDSNKDGKVTMNEIPEKLRPRIARLFQQSGKSPQEGITEADLKKFASKRPGKKFGPPKGKPKKKT